MLTAKDIMTRNVLTVRPDASIHDVAKMLVDRSVSALPVVDDERRILGVISEGDLLRRVEIGTETPSVGGWRSFFVRRAELAERYVKAHAMRADELMSAPVISIPPSMRLVEVVDVLVNRRIKRVPVVEDGALTGIVSRADVVGALVMAEASGQSPSGDDRQIQKALLGGLAKESWFDRGQLNILVVDGVAQLWGSVESEEVRRALIVAAETTPGVKGVEDHLVVGEPSDSHI